MATYEENLAQMSQPYDFAPLPIRGGGQGRAFSGLLGDIFGGGGGATGLEEYLTPAQTEQMNRQALLQAAIAASQASAPSTTPRSFMQILGAGLAGGQQGYQQAQEGAMKQLITKQKLDEYRRQKALETAAQKIIMGEGGAVPDTMITPQQAISAPVTAELPAGPTMARAEMIGQAMPGAPVSQTDAVYDRYMKLSQLFAASDPAKAKSYQELAKTLKPTPEVVGEPYRTADGKTYQRTKTGGRIEVPAAEAPAVEPIGEMKEVTDATGKPVLVQRYKDGSIKTVEGFGVPRELVQVNLGGKIQFVDKNNIPANATYLTGMSPGEEARLKIDQANLQIAMKRLNLSQAEFQRGQYDRVETADGFAYVPKVPGLPTIPITGQSGEQLVGKSSFTEDQGKSAGFALRMKESTDIFKRPVIDPNTQKPMVVGGKIITIEDAYGAPNRYQAIMRSIPSAGLTTGIASFSETSGRQQYRQAQENWVSANLRAESGAVLGTEEIDKEIKKYFPQVDDKPEVIKQKAQARKSTELAMEVRGGPALKAINKAQQQAQPTGGLTWNPATQQFQ
jgi:hypothetical protein